jgi:predicted acetyltransferase
MDLVTPDRAYLPSYLDALRREWSSTTVDPDFWRAELERVEADPDLALAQFNQRDGGGRTLTLPDGTEVQRIPGVVRWMWDGAFAGAINARWQPGTAELPPYVLGHIGYSVVPWRQRRGYATEALRQMLDLVRREGLPYVEITTQPDNVGSQKVIEANGGVSLGEFVEPEGYGGHIGVKYRVALD